MAAARNRRHGKGDQCGPTTGGGHAAASEQSPRDECRTRRPPRSADRPGHGWPHRRAPTFPGRRMEGLFLERVYAHTRRLGGCQGASLAGDGLACRERQPDPPQAGLAGFRADANTAACDGMNEPPHLAETTRWRARAHMTPTRVATWQPAQRAAARRIRPMALLPRRSPGLPLPDRTSAKLADGQRCQSSIGARVPEPGRTGGDRRLPPGPCRHGYGAYPGVSPSPARGSGGNRRVRSGAVVCRARQPIPGR